MRIHDVKVLPIGHNLEKPIRWGSFEISVKGSVLVRVSTGEGIIGWGEAGFSSDFYPMIKPIVDEILQPILIGRDPFEIEKIWEDMYRATHKWGRRGMETYAISGVDIALWDIIGKACDKPVYKVLGGYQDRIKAYFAPSLKEASVISKEVEAAVEDGFKAIKLRVGLGMDEDLEIVRSARQVAGDGVDLMVDANMAYDNKTALEMAKRFSDFDIRWLEEPILVESPEQYTRELSKLTSSVGIYIAGGESLFTRYEFTEIIANHAVDIIQPDCTSVGGISEAKKIASMASAWNMPCVPHVACSSLGIVNLAANLHLNGSISNSLFLSYDAYQSPIRKELVDEPIEAVDGHVTIPDKPGLGVEMDEQAVGKYCLLK